jgi:membrane protease YdiL (CAAX protease family)
LYLILAYGLAWIVWIPVALTRQDYQESPLLLAAVLVGVFGPGMAGIIVTWRERGRSGLRDFWRRATDFRRIRARWYLIILLLYPALQLLAIAISLLAGNDWQAPALLQQVAAQPIQAPIVLILYFLQAGLEELGWRGYMLDRVQPGRGPLRASLVVGLFHAFWHLPTFWIVGTNQIEMGFRLDFLLFVLTATATSFYETWSYYGNGRSTMAATLLHTVGNLLIDLCTEGPGTFQFRTFSLLIVAGAVMIAGVWAWRGRGYALSERRSSPAA